MGFNRFDLYLHFCYVYTLRTQHRRVKSGFSNSSDVKLSLVVHIDMCTCLILCHTLGLQKSWLPYLLPAKSSFPVYDLWPKWALPSRTGGMSPLHSNMQLAQVEISSPSPLHPEPHISLGFCVRSAFGGFLCLQAEPAGLLGPEKSLWAQGKVFVAPNSNARAPNSF